MNWFNVAIRRVINSLPVLRLMRRLDSVAPYRFSERGMLAQAFEFIRFNQIPGDYFEFGLWQGRTFILASRFRRLHRFADMHLIGFDSFQGLPTVNTSKDEVWTTGQYSCSEKELRSILLAHGVSSEEFTLVPGFYTQSLNDELHAAMTGRKAALVYIDCDLYESTVPVLNFIQRYVNDGTLVCFDDFYCYAGRPDRGEQRALDEFLRAHPELEFQRYLTYCPLGQSFIVHRRPAKTV
jgi:O-methyltransferase